jgi:surfactin synthase thioesterase subunit
MPRSIQLFCLPFAGGSSVFYKDFSKYLPDSVKVVAIDLPGHGRKMAQPLLTSLHDMAVVIFQQIDKQLTEPYAILGHSMGTLLTYLVSKRIKQANLPLPIHLFVSGRAGPSIPLKETNWHLLPTPEFLAKVMPYGGIPRQIAADKALMELFVPIMRADFQALAEYQYAAEAPLEIPITVLIGSEEDIADAEALTWQQVTTCPVLFSRFPGGHFFLVDHLPEICALISRTLQNSSDFTG